MKTRAMPLIYSNLILRKPKVMRMKERTKRRKKKKEIKKMKKSKKTRKRKKMRKIKKTRKIMKTKKRKKKNLLIVIFSNLKRVFKQYTFCLRKCILQMKLADKRT